MAPPLCPQSSPRRYVAPLPPLASPTAPAWKPKLTDEMNISKPRELDT